MNEVPFHFWSAVAVAVRIGQVIARTGLCHPASDTAADNDIMDWAAEFAAGHGAFPSSIGSPTDRELHKGYVKALENFAVQKAHFDGWIPLELRDTLAHQAMDVELNREIAAVKRIKALPPTLPISSASRALLAKVGRELQYRALRQLEQGVAPGLLGAATGSAELSAGCDGRFHVLFAHDVPIAHVIPELGSTPVIDEWINAVRSGLGVQVDPCSKHQILIEVNGQPVACTSHEVRLEVINQRLSDQADSSLLMVLTEEGVVTDLTRRGEYEATRAQMYDDIAGDLTPNRRDAQAIGA